MELIYLRQAHKFIRKANQDLRSKLELELLQIQQDPQIGKLLRGNLASLRSYKFIFKKVNYRIAYYIKNNIIVVAIATRENFYKDLQI